MTITVQWLGDIALTGQYLDPGNHGRLRDNVRMLLAHLEAADLRIANWEAPLLGDEGLNPLKKLAIHTDADTAQHALPLDLDVALLANNHIFDCLGSGFDATVGLLSSAGTAVVGAGRCDEAARAPLVMERNGISVAILSYVDEGTHPQVPLDSRLHLNMLHRDRLMGEVERWAGEMDAVLVHLHCGIDFLPLPSPEHRSLARDAMRSGATAVVSYHPHRLQGHERCGDGLIVHSLGNLLAGSIYPWPRFTEPTAVVTCRIESRRVTEMSVRYFLLRDSVLKPDVGGRGERILKKLNRQLASSDEHFARLWRRYLLRDLMITRPLHFLRRHRSPLKILRALETRQAAEYWSLIKGIWNRRTLR